MPPAHCSGDDAAEFNEIVVLITTFSARHVRQRIWSAFDGRSRLGIEIVADGRVRDLVGARVVRETKMQEF